MKKRFIEWDLPLAEISEASAREKSIRHGHPSTLHIWWARRPLASSRATNFAALIDLPDDKKKRDEITELIKNIVPWEAVKNGNDKWIRKAQELIKEQWGDTPPKVLDPFTGGGSIPLEALRLGCETYANDYNPVAVFIEKATLEWPQKFGIMIPHPDKLPGIDGEKEKVNFLAYMVEKWANIVLEQAREEIGRFYPPDPDGSIPVGYIWARTVPCQNPSCGAVIPLVRQFWLANKMRKKVAFKPRVNYERKKVEFKILAGNALDDELKKGFDPNDATVRRGKTKCLVCSNIIGREVMKLAQLRKMKQRMIAVVTYRPTKTGKQYRLATKGDVELFGHTEVLIKKKVDDWQWLDNPLPDEQIFQGKRERTPQWLWASKYGMPRWKDLFNSRQKLALIIFMEKIKQIADVIGADCQSLRLEVYGIKPMDATKAIIGYLGIIFNRCVDKGSTLARWNSAGEKIEATFARQALSMLWDFVEINFFSGVNGDWSSQMNWVLRYIKTNSWRASEKASISSFSASTLPFPKNSFTAVFTDPPYYDNVPYADLSDFFYVWLKRNVGDFFPRLFSTPLSPKSSEAIAHFRRHDNPVEFFENMLSDSFKEVHRILKPDGIATIVYAHKTTDGWETMLNSLVNAGLVVTASWPVHTEMKSRLRAASCAALASSIYMVCRKTEREKVGFYSELKPRIKTRIEEKLQQFWSEGIAGGDFFISAIGPGMEIFSRYERVEKLSGEKVTTGELLDFIRQVSTNYIVRKLLKSDSAAIIDKESEFYLAYRWTFLDNTIEFDDARKLASANGVSLEENWGPSGFIKKSGSKISVLGPKDRGKFSDRKCMVDVVHRCLLHWEKGEKNEIIILLEETGHKANPAFKQFCQAVAECLTNGNKEKQLLEGFLLGVDSYSKEKVKLPDGQTGLDEFGGGD